MNVDVIGEAFIPGFNLQDAFPPVKGVSLNEHYVVHAGDLLIEWGWGWNGNMIRWMDGQITQPANNSS